MLKYAAVLEKDGEEAILYFGSESSVFEGADPRVKSYKGLSKLSKLVMYALGNGFELSQLGIMQLIPYKTLPFGEVRLKAWLKMLEATNTYAFWSVHQSEKAKPGMTL